MTSLALSNSKSHGKYGQSHALDLWQQQPLKNAIVRTMSTVLDQARHLSKIVYTSNLSLKKKKKKAELVCYSCSSSQFLN